MSYGCRVCRRRHASASALLINFFKGFIDFFFFLQVSTVHTYQESSPTANMLAFTKALCNPLMVRATEPRALLSESPSSRRSLECHYISRSSADLMAASRASTAAASSASSSSSSVLSKSTFAARHDSIKHTDTFHSTHVFTLAGLCLLFALDLRSPARISSVSK